MIRNFRGGYELTKWCSSNINRFKEIFKVRSWLNDFGYIKVSKSGAMLERMKLFDEYVFSPERLDFVSGAVLPKKWKQERPPAKLYKGTTFDIASIPSLTPEEKKSYKTMVAGAKEAKLPDAEKTQTIFINAKAEKAHKKNPTLTLTQHADIIRTACNNNDLYGSFEIIINGVPTTVDEILKNPNKYDGVSCNDPLESDVEGKSQIFLNIGKGNEKPTIHSFLHGNKNYFLHSGMKEELNEEKILWHDFSDAIFYFEKLKEFREANFITVECLHFEVKDFFNHKKFDEFNLCHLKDFAKKEFKINKGSIDKEISKNNESNGDNDGLSEDLINLIKDEAELFHNPENEAFISITVNDHIETMSVQSCTFKEYVNRIAYGNFKKAVSDVVYKAVQSTITAIAIHDGEEHQTFLRFAPFNDGYVIDLCNENYEVVYVTPDSWSILSQLPIKFYRTKTMQSLPKPDSNGDLKKIWNYINISEQDKPLYLAWVLECYRPDTPYPIAEIQAGEGSAKSSSQDKTRALIDPNATNLRAAPKNTEDIFVSAKQNALTSYNNISHLSSRMQDTLCTLATGGGFASRTLYSNVEETVIECKRPVIINGISNLATAPDLLSRCINFELEPIKKYIEETKLDADFKEDKPAIFGGLLDLFSATLQKLPDVKIDSLPRMADFAKFGEAMMQSTGQSAGEFSSLYKDKRENVLRSSLDSSPVIIALQKYVSSKGFDMLYNITMSNLLDKLNEYKAFYDGWVKSPKGLKDVLKRYQKPLALIGIEIVFYRKGSNNEAKRDHTIIRSCSDTQTF